MDNSIYIVLSRQLAQFEDMNVTSNNIANASTAGYNAQKLVFSQYLQDAGNQTKDAYANDPTSYRDTSTGAFQTTDNPLDLAISGHAYFQIQTPNGVRYTKAGNFQVNADGMIVTNMGYPVLGNDGATLSIPPDAKHIEVNAIGQLSSDGQALGQVGMVEFANEQSLTRLGNTLYDSKAAPTPSLTAHMVQGALESSNVNGVSELTKVMTISRSVGDTAKFIETMYDLERKSATTFTQIKTA